MKQQVKNTMFGNSGVLNANIKVLISKSKKGLAHYDLTKLKINISKKVLNLMIRLKLK